MLDDIIRQSAYKFKERARKSKSNNSSYESRKTAAALKVEADEIGMFSRSETAKAGMIDAALLGMLAAFCYGHLQVTNDIREHMIGNGFSSIASELDSIAEPFQERSLYVLTALNAHN